MIRSTDEGDMIGKPKPPGPRDTHARAAPRWCACKPLLRLQVCMCPSRARDFRRSLALRVGMEASTRHERNDRTTRLARNKAMMRDVRERKTKA